MQPPPSTTAVEDASGFECFRALEVRVETLVDGGCGMIVGQ